MAKRRRNNYKAQSFTRGYFSTGRTEEILKEMGERVLQAAKDALKAGADKVVQDAKSRCHVYAGHQNEKTGKIYFAKGVTPGALRDSITAEPKKNETVYQISANAKSADGYLYGQIVEFSPRVNHPFLYPAMEACRKDIKKSIEEAIKAAVKKGG